MLQLLSPSEKCADILSHLAGTSWSAYNNIHPLAQFFPSEPQATEQNVMIWRPALSSETRLSQSVSTCHFCESPEIKRYVSRPHKQVTIPHLFGASALPHSTAWLGSYDNSNSNVVQWAEWQNSSVLLTLLDVIWPVISTATTMFTFADWPILEKFQKLSLLNKNWNE